MLDLINNPEASGKKLVQRYLWLEKEYWLLQTLLPPTSGFAVHYTLFLFLVYVLARRGMI